MIKIMSKTKEDSWEIILKKRFEDDVYKKFRKSYTDDFLEKESFSTIEVILLEKLSHEPALGAKVQAEKRENCI